MTNPASFGATAAMALVLVLMNTANGLAQNRNNERAGESTSVPPRPPMRTYRPSPVVAPLAPPPYRNAAPVPPAAAMRPGDHDGGHDGDRDGGHDGDRGAFAAGVAADVVIGGAAATPGIYNVPAPSPVDDPAAYCAWMYSSYDPQSGTYIGDDGNPHPCPP
jgi:hypothetical protein